MRLKPPPPLGLAPPEAPGTFAVLPALWDLGGRPGTAAGAAWLGRALAAPEVAELAGVPYAPLPPVRFDLPFARVEPSLYAAAQTLAVWRCGYRPLWLCGDHGLALGPVRAAAACGRPVTVFIFDAHDDRHEGRPVPGDGCLALENEVHQGNVVAWMAREGAVERIVVVGLRHGLPEAAGDAAGKVEVLEASAVLADVPAARRWALRRLREARARRSLVDLSLDVDVLDPAAMPAVDHPIAGGLPLAVLLELALPVARQAASVDVSELNPVHDPAFEGRRAILNVVCQILAQARPEVGSEAWGAALAPSARRPVLPLGPETRTLLGGDGNPRELDAAEAALLAQGDTEELRSLFRDEALARAARSLKEALHPARGPAPRRRSPARAPRRSPDAWLEGGGGHVEGLAISPDGGRLAAADWDGAIYLWRLAGEARPLRLEAHTAWVIGVGFSPCGGWLGSASDDHTLRLWNLSDLAAEPRVRSDHPQWVKALAWHPGGGRLASAAFDGRIAVWDVDTATPLVRPAGHPDAIWGLAWSPDGRRLASCGEGGRLRLWDAAEGGLLGDLTGHTHSVERCRFSSDGRLWSLSRAGELIGYDGGNAPAEGVETGRTGFDLALLEHPGRVLVAGIDGVRVLDARDLSPVCDLEVDFPVSSVVAWDRYAAVAGDCDRVALFDLEAS